jgi:hypothetical protein
MDNKKKDKYERPESYPRPTETDEQLKNQPEYTDQQPNYFRDKTISDFPAGTAPQDDTEQIKKTDDGRVE